MARRYRVGLVQRLVNAAVRFRLWTGWMPARYYLLTVSRRRTGKPYSTPVIVVRHGGARWLVSPYGERGWTRNARRAGTVTLSRRGHSEIVAVEAVGPEEAAPVLRQYLAETPITRPYFDVTPTAPLAEFAREAPRHPVFRIIERGAGR